MSNFYNWLNEVSIIKKESEYPSGTTLSLKHKLPSKKAEELFGNAGYKGGHTFTIDRDAEPEETLEFGKGEESIVVKDQDGKSIRLVGSINAIEKSFLSVMAGTKKARKDPHELMTCALCLNNTIYSGDEDPEEIISTIKPLAKQVVGWDESELEAFDSNYDALAAAISASNSIFKNFSKSIDRVFITGRNWDDEIKGFKMESGTIRDYNSSDIVVRDGKRFLGVSLKKKGRGTEKDPTLINKALESFFEGILQEREIKSIHEAKVGFFKEEVLEIKERISDKEVFKRLREHIRDKSNRDRMVDLLKSPKNRFFKKIDEVLKINTRDFIEKFLKTAFRVDLVNLKKYDFDFALVTGVGRYLKKSGLTIEKAGFHDIETTVSSLDDLIGNSKLSLEKPKGKKQAFEPGSTSVRLVYYIMADNKPLVELEIRYKGDYSGNPSFQAYATPVLKNII